MENFDFGALGEQLLKVVVPVLVAALGALLANTLRAVNAWAKVKFTAAQSSLLLDLAGHAVRAAAQYLDGKEGQEKKEWAVNFLKQLAADAGFKNVNVDVLAGLVETAWKKYKDDNAIDWPLLIDDDGYEGYADTDEEEKPAG